MKLKLLPLLLIVSITSPLFSQNIFVDSNQVALFINGNFVWSELSQTTNISGGVSIGGILDFGYQYGSTIIEAPNSYNRDIEYNVHSFLVSVILTEKKILLSLDVALAGGNSATILLLGFTVAKRYRLENSLEAVLNLSTGIAFNLQEFPQNQEFAITLGADLFSSKIIYFGPGIGYSNKEFFYGFDVGIVIPFSHNTKN